MDLRKINLKTITTMTTSERVFEYLKYQGLVPEFDDRKSIRYKYQMKNFFYINNDNDPPFINLTLPNIFEVTDDNRMAVFEAINEVNENTKVVKLTIYKNQVWCATEIMLDSTPELDELFPRLMNILMIAQQKFYDIIEQ